MKVGKRGKGENREKRGQSVGHRRVKSSDDSANVGRNGTSAADNGERTDIVTLLRGILS